MVKSKENWKVRKKKNLSWLFGMDSKISKTVTLGTDFSTPNRHQTVMRDFYNIFSFYIGKCMPLASCCSWGDRFESYLVENPEDRFFRDEAQLWYFLDLSSGFCFSIYENIDITKTHLYICVHDIICHEIMISCNAVYIITLLIGQYSIFSVGHEI